MIKNIWAGDIALLELLAGETQAPPDVLKRLAAIGHVQVIAGAPKLSLKGLRRARQLKACEHDLRKQFSAKGGSSLTTDGSTGFHVGGGRANIRP
jgi:hypothetical protein